MAHLHQEINPKLFLALQRPENTRTYRWRSTNRKFRSTTTWMLRCNQKGVHQIFLCYHHFLFWIESKFLGKKKLSLQLTRNTSPYVLQNNWPAYYWNLHRCYQVISVTDQRSTSDYSTFLWGNLFTWRRKNKNNAAARRGADCRGWIQRNDERGVRDNVAKLDCSRTGFANESTNWNIMTIKLQLHIAQNPIQHAKLSMWCLIGNL